MPRTPNGRVRNSRLDTYSSLLTNGEEEDRFEDADFSLSNESGSESSLFNKLNSTDRSDREWACSALSHAMGDPDQRVLILNQFCNSDSMSHLVSCLCDSEPLVVFASIGLTQSILLGAELLDMSEQVTQAMMNHQILMPLLSIFSNTTLFVQSDDPSKALNMEEHEMKIVDLQSLQTKVFARLFACLGNLCALSDQAIFELTGTHAEGIKDIIFTQLQNTPIVPTSISAEGATKIHYNQDASISSAFLLVQLTNVLGGSPDILESILHFNSLLANEQISFLKAICANGKQTAPLRVLCLRSLVHLFINPNSLGESDSKLYQLISTMYPIINNIFNTFDASAAFLALENMKAEALLESNQQHMNGEIVQHPEIDVLAVNPSDSFFKLQNSPAMLNYHHHIMVWNDNVDAQRNLMDLLASLLVLTEDLDSETLEMYDDSDIQLHQNPESTTTSESPSIPMFPKVSEFLASSSLSSILVPKSVYPNPTHSSLYPFQEEKPIIELTKSYIDKLETWSALQIASLGCLHNAMLNPAFASHTLEGYNDIWRSLCDAILAPISRSMAQLSAELQPILNLPAKLSGAADKGFNHLPPRIIYMWNQIIFAVLPVLLGLQRLLVSSGLSVHYLLEDLQGILDLYNSASPLNADEKLFNHNVRAACLSVLASASSGPYIASNFDQNHVLNFMSVLLNNLIAALSPNEGHEINAEAANAIMDIYAETEWNSIVQESGLLNSLKDFNTKLLATIKTLNIALKKRNSDVSQVMFDRLDETRLNVSRFMSYKYKQFK